jgi:hypothetical protein
MTPEQQQEILRLDAAGLTSRQAFHPVGVGGRSNPHQPLLRWPDTFEIPDAKERYTIPLGWFAKLMFQTPDGDTERMWVKVVDAWPEEGEYVGMLVSWPIITRLEAGDIVPFHARHVCAVREPQSE